MFRASALQSVDLGFIPLVKSHQKTFKMVFTALLVGARHLGDVVENNSASSFAVALSKAINWTLHLCVVRRWPRHFKNGNSQASADIPPKI